MPGLIQSSDILLDFTNDTHDYTTLQLLRDYNLRNGNSTNAVLIPPGESVTLVLNAGSIYKYVLKTRSKVASVTARAWQDTEYSVSQLFVPGTPIAGPPPSSTIATTGSRASASVASGVTVDKIWRDMRVSIWDWGDL